MHMYLLHAYISYIYEQEINTKIYLYNIRNVVPEADIKDRDH